MEFVTVYRQGSRYAWEQCAGEMERVTLALADGVRVGRSALGARLLYPERAVYGIPLEAALKTGLCRIVEP